LGGQGATREQSRDRIDGCWRSGRCADRRGARVAIFHVHDIPDLWGPALLGSVGEQLRHGVLVYRATMEKDAAGADYTGYHSLIKIDGQWKVVAKLFHLYDQ
jgi:hypothetical protein